MDRTDAAESRHVRNRCIAATATRRAWCRPRNVASPVSAAAAVGSPSSSCSLLEWRAIVSKRFRDAQATRRIHAGRDRRKRAPPIERVVGHGEEFGIQQRFLRVVSQRLVIECHDRTTRRFEHRVRRGDVPLRCRDRDAGKDPRDPRRGCTASTNYRQACDPPKRIAHRQSVDERFKSLAAVTAARDHDNSRVAIHPPRVHRGDATLIAPLRASCRNVAGVDHDVLRRNTDDTEHRAMSLDQRDVHRELAVAIDELLGAVERIDQPVPAPATCASRNPGSSTPPTTPEFPASARSSASANRAMRRKIRLCERRRIVFRNHVEVRLVHLHDLATRVVDDFDERIDELSMGWCLACGLREFSAVSE